MLSMGRELSMHLHAGLSAEHSFFQYVALPHLPVLENYYAHIHYFVNPYTEFELLY